MVINIENRSVFLTIGLPTQIFLILSKKRHLSLQTTKKIQLIFLVKIERCLWTLLTLIGSDPARKGCFTPRAIVLKVASVAAGRRLIVVTRH